MNHNLLGRESYSLQLHYKLFIDGNQNKVFQQQHVKIIRQGENMQVKQSSGIEMIETKDLDLVFDHNGKLFSARKKDIPTDHLTTEKKNLLTMFNTYVDTLMNAFESIKIVSEDKNTILYECRPKEESQAAIIWLEIDKKQKIYKSITTQFREKRKIKELNNQLHQITLKVEYNGFNTNPIIHSNQFNVTNYVVMNNQQVTGPAKKYENYTFLNPTH